MQIFSREERLGYKGSGCATLALSEKTPWFFIVPGVKHTVHGKATSISTFLDNNQYLALLVGRENLEKSSQKSNGHTRNRTRNPWSESPRLYPWTIVPPNNE